MGARTAVMRAWRASLDRPLPACEDGQPPSGEANLAKAGLLVVRPLSGGWQRSSSGDGGFRRPLADDSEDDPEIRPAAKPGDIVPKRPRLSSEETSSESLWTSHHFWKGIVIGATVVLLIKTALAIQVPYGVDWYGF